jgi:hypothetical protein
MMRRRSACGLILLLFVCEAQLQAQPPAPPAAADEPAGRRVYVPVEDLDVVLEHDKQGVILSRAEFLKLAADAKKNLDETPQSPHKFVVSAAQYAARVQDEQLIVSAVIQLNQLARGWQMVTLPYRGLAVEAATLDDKPARIGRAAAEGRPLVVLSQDAGKHTLKLELTAPLVTVGSDKVAAFGLAPISSATLNLSLPAGKFLHVDEVPLERPAAADQPAVYDVALGGKSNVTLRITDRRTQHDGASLVFAGTAIGLHVAPEERTWRAVTSLNVFGKPIDNLTFVVPKSLEIVSVESTGLERWEIGEGPGGNTTTLKLVYRQPFNDSRTATFSGVSASEIGQPWSVPTLTLSGATSHLVRVLVQHPAGLRLQQVEATAVRRVTSDEAPEPDMPGMPDMTVKVGTGQQWHYAAWREDFALLFVTQPRDRELQATIATRIDINSRELALHASIAIQSRFAPLFDFDLALPVDWNVTDVLVENRPVAWRTVPIEAGLRQVRVQFPSPIPADGKVNLTLAARLITDEHWPIEDQPLSFKLPEVSLPQVGVTDGRYMIAAEDDLDIVPEEVTGLDPVRVAADQQQAAAAPRLVYEYQDTRFGGTLKVSRKPVRVAAQTLAFQRLDRETLNSHLEARMVVQGGGLQKLQVALPESAGTNLRFSLVDPPGSARDRRPRITEQTAAAPADGERIWTLQLDERAFGLLWLVVDLTAPRSADAASFDLPGLRIVSADRQNGFVAVEGGPDQKLDITTADASGQSLIDVDPADVPVARGYAPQERVVAAYRAVRPGFRVTLKETRFDREAVPTAVCDKARLASVVGESGQRQHKAEFLLRAIGVQSLEVKLPAEARLWATLIDGKPIEVRTLEPAASGAKAWIVPLPQGSDARQTHSIQLFYGTDGQSLESSGKLTLEPPHISAISGGEDKAQPIKILDREWTLDHPGQTDITSSSGDFDPIEKPSRISLLGRLHHSLALVSPKDLWQKALQAAIVGAAIWIFFFAWRRRGIAGAAVTALVGMILIILSISFYAFSTQEHSSAGYYAESDRSFKVAPHQGGASFGFGEERYGKVPVRDPMAPAPTMAPPPGPRSGSGQVAGVPQEAPGRDTVSFEVAGEKDAEERGAGAEGLIVDGSVRFKKIPQSRAEIAEQRRIRALERNAVEEAKILADQVGDRSNPNTVAGNMEKLRRDSGLANTLGQPPLAAGQFDDVFQADPAARKASAARGDQRGAALKGALLSLAIDLPASPGNRKTAFRYTGDPATGSNPALEVEYQNRRALSFVALAIQAGVLLVFWFARRWSGSVRAALGVLGLVVPLALVSVVPLEALPYLDGLFLGSLWGLALWLLVAIFTHRREIGKGLRADIFRSSSMIFVAFAVAGGFATHSLAQDTKPPANAAAPGEGEARVRTGAPTIVIPYDSDKDPLQAGRVFLPWEKFLELWNAAHPDKAAQPPAPTDGLVAEALYAVEIPAAAAGRKPTTDVSGRFVLHSFRDDQISLVLPLGRVALTRAQLDGQSAALVTRDAGSGPELTVVVPARGIHVLDVKFTLPVEQTGAAGKFTLPTQPVAAGSLRLTLPANDLNLRVSGGAAAFRKVRDNEKSIAIIPVDQGGGVTVAWTPSQTREAMQGIVHVESATALFVGDAGLRLNSSFKYAVRQGAISDVVYALPPGLLVRQITGLDLGGWEIAGEGANRTLKVFLRRPVSDSTTVQFDLYMAQPFTEQAQPVAVPQLVPQGVTREIGTLGVFAERQLAVTAGGATGLAQIDLGQFVAPAPLNPAGTTAPGKVAPPTAPLYAWRFAARPVQLQLLVTRQKPQSKGMAEHAVYLGSRKLRIASRLEMHLTGAPRSEIAVQLPAGYLLYDLKSNDAVDYHVETRPGVRAGEQNALLIVELPAPRTGAIELVLDGVVSRAPEDLAPAIGVPVPLAIGELRSSLAVWLDRIYTATLEDFTGWKSIDPGELPERLRAAQSSPVQFAFTSNLTGVQPLALALSRAVPRLSADALSVIIARDTSLQYFLYLRWNIAAAGETTFVFTTPDWLADRLEFERSTGVARIRQVLSEKIAGNRLRWKVILDDPRTSVSTLLAQAVLPPDAARVAAPAVTFEQPVAGENGGQYQPLEQQRQYLVLVNQSPKRLEQEARNAVEAIPAVDLPIRISQTISDQATEILRIRDAKAAIGWRIQGAQQLKSLAASVNLAKMTLVIARDGSWRGEARYRVNNRSRQFLALAIPPQSQILSLFVDGRASRPINPKLENQADVVLVPLPKTAAGDLSVEVKLVYAGRFGRPLPKGVQVLRSELDLPAPQVVAQGDFGMPVAATEWTVILPPDIDARPVDDSNRTNVAESGAGGEDLIAWYNEMQNLYVILLDESQSMRAQSRAQNNLKQIGLAVQNYSAVESSLVMSDQNLRQQGQLLDLKSKVQQAEKQWQAQQAAQAGKRLSQVVITDGTSQTLVVGGALSNKDVQRELIADNKGDFRADRLSDESEQLPKIELEQAPADTARTDAAPQPPGKQSGKPRAANRRALREQTESQSLLLNKEVLAQPEPGQSDDEPQSQRLAGKRQAAAKDADADEVFEQSNAKAEQSFRRPNAPAGFSPDGREMSMGGASANVGGPGGAPVRGQGMGGMGAGIAAGPMAAGDQAADVGGAEGEAVAGWTTAGGLSLDMALPREGQALTFSKSGGDARLALGMRPRASLETGFGLAWTVVWLLVGLGLIAALGRGNAFTALVRWLPPIMLGVGLAWYFLLPTPAVGFALFVIGAVCFGWQHRRA